MGKNLTHKILNDKKKSDMTTEEGNYSIVVDQTLTQDSTGTMVYLQLDALAPKKLKTKLSVAYIDHNMLQTSFRNADDHAFIASSCKKYGVVYSKAGNGICHQLHLENYAKPGEVLVGSDSHTPTCGAMGMLAFGAGGLDVAIGMAKGVYNIQYPSVMGVELIGKRADWVSAKDVILEILKVLTVKGGVGYIIEYFGEGVLDLDVTERATITNMGAELGATTSIFPSDSYTRKYLIQHGREEDYMPLEADKDATYDKVIKIDLSKIVPLVALPHSPDNVKKIQELGQVKVDQVAIGSCTNSSYNDLMKVSQILKGKKISEEVSLIISPGSTRVLNAIAQNGALAELIASGARLLESGCGPCIGMGQAPRSGGKSLRTFNRNFKGRCGTADADVYLVSPETAAASALTGYLTNPTTLGKKPLIKEVESFKAIDNFWVKNKVNQDTELVKGSNIKDFPIGVPLATSIEKHVLLKTKDNVTTDDIMPSNASLLPYRSNIPYLADYAFNTLVSDFKERSEKMNGGIVVGGDNYGQGSSREHAALVPLYLGVKAVIVKSFARIHKQNLINAGILPLVFFDNEDYNGIEEGDVLVLSLTPDALSRKIIEVNNTTKKYIFNVELDVSKREMSVLKAGGALLYERQKN